MDAPRFVRENPKSSITTLLALIESEDNQWRRSVYIRDFMSKLSGLPRDYKAHFLSRLLLMQIPEETKTLIGDIDMGELSPKPFEDIAIMTIRKPELTGAQLALGIDPKTIEKSVADGYSIWHTQMPCDRRENPLGVILTMSGLVRNVHCANACHAVFNKYNVGLCVLIGIGAGDPTHHKLGDVVAANTVIDVEGGRLESTGLKIRPETVPVRLELARYLEDFDPDLVEWYELLSSRVDILSKIKNPPEGLGDDWKPSFEVGPIFVSEKLRVDTPWKKLQEQYHQEGRTIEMESIGFAMACESRGVPWLVFRGISDFGEPKSKNGTRGDQIPSDKDLWQPYAALAAATAAVSFIKNCLRLVDAKRL